MFFNSTFLTAGCSITVSIPNGTGAVMGAGSLQPPVHSPAWDLQPVASHFQAVCVVQRFSWNPGSRFLVAETMMTGFVEWLSLLWVCVETNVEHEGCVSGFLSVSIWLASCDERQKHSLVFASIGRGRGGRKFLVSSNFSDKESLKIELYHSCRLLLMILLQHNVAGNVTSLLICLWVLQVQPRNGTELRIRQNKNKVAVK